MTTQLLRRAIRFGFVAIVLAMFVGLVSMASAAGGTKQNVQKPGGGSSGGATHGSVGNTSHGASGGASSHGLTGGGGSHGLTGGGTTHGSGISGAGSHGPTTGGIGSHGPTTGGATNMNNGGGGTTTHGPTTGGGTHSDDWEHTGGKTGGATTHANDGGITHGAAIRGTHANDGGITHNNANFGASHSAFGSGHAPKGSNERLTRSGDAVRTRPGGRVSDVHDARRGMDVHHGLNGNRRVSMERPGHGRLVSERGRRGYAQRGYNYHGHEYGRRAYYYHGHEYNRYYRGYGYHGTYLNVYAPGYYYSPGFYGWAYHPWRSPITFGWGWGGAPWYGFYGGYFSPYPSYSSAAFWLTDYVISQDLQAAYAAHKEAGENDGTPVAAGGPPALTPEVKQLVADEVKNQLALENSEAQQNAQHQDVDPASSSIARLLSDGHPHVFVAGAALDLTDASGKECSISDGDVLQLQTSPSADATTADLVVLASKGGNECEKSTTVSVQLTDLQEMQNQLRETVDQGLQELQAKQGKDGLPPAPPSAQAPPTQTEYAQAAPPADPQDAADIQQQGQQADQAEKEVTAEAATDSSAPVAAAPDASASSTAAPAASTASVEIGQTTDQVQAAMGPPTRVANLGAKVIYYYNGMKVIFKDGKVTDVQ